MNGYQIECISLSKKYSDRSHTIVALDDVSLQIMKNETVIIKGRSGSGKSTLLSLMCGLIKPTSGKVIIDATCITDLKEDSLSTLLSDKIGIIFQSFNLLPTYTVYENIEIALIPKGYRKEVIKEQIITLLDKFNLENEAQSLPSALSAGQQQKVAIVRTLAKNPAVIFADEPTGSVDEETAGEILEHLLNIKKERELTLVLATHGNIADRLADKVFFLENGRLIK